MACIFNLSMKKTLSSFFFSYVILIIQSFLSFSFHSILGINLTSSSPSSLCISNTSQFQCQLELSSDPWQIQEAFCQLKRFSHLGSGLHTWRHNWKSSACRCRCTDCRDDSDIWPHEIHFKVQPAVWWDRLRYVNGTNFGVKDMLNKILGSHNNL